MGGRVLKKRKRWRTERKIKQKKEMEESDQVGGGEKESLRD